MSISLLRITCEHLSNFKNGVLSLDFFAEKRVLSEEVEDGTVYRLFGRIYKLNTVALAGINATERQPFCRYCLICLLCILAMAVSITQCVLSHTLTRVLVLSRISIKKKKKLFTS